MAFGGRPREGWDTNILFEEYFEEWLGFHMDWLAFQPKRNYSYTFQNKEKGTEETKEISFSFQSKGWRTPLSLDDLDGLAGTNVPHYNSEVLPCSVF